MKYLIQLLRFLLLPACTECGCHKPGRGTRFFKGPWVCFECLERLTVEPRTWYGEL